MDGCPVETQSGFHRGAHVFYQDVRTLDHAMQEGAPFLPFEVETQASFVPVEIQVVRRVMSEAAIRSRSLFDAYDVGAPVRELANGGRSRSGNREIENQQIGERKSIGF